MYNNQIVPTPVPVLISGTYTPTLTIYTNTTLPVAFACQYFRLGSIVTVSGFVAFTCPSLGVTELHMSVPIASAFTAVTNCGGAANSSNSNDGASVGADPPSGTAKFVLTASYTGSHTYSFTFSYLVI